MFNASDLGEEMKLETCEFLFRFKKTQLLLSNCWLYGGITVPTYDNSDY